MRSLSRFGLPIVVAALVGIGAYAATGNSQSGTWTVVGETSTVRANAATALLYDGRVLVTGGRSADGLLRSAELFTPDAGFSAARSMQSARSGHAAVALFDGRVLVTGGVGTDGMAMNSAETYDPWTGTWQPLSSSMTEPRAGHTATLLDDGRVLIAGGDVAGVPSSTFEVFDPALDAFRTAGILSAPRTYHAATLLPDGRVLIAGGTDGNVALASMDVVDADAGWVAQAMMTTGRFGLTATTLLDGRVLLAGGSALQAELASTELYDPATGGVAAGAPLTQARTGHLAFRLPNNNAVLVAGGSIAGTSLGSSELYYPWSDVWSASGSLNTLKSASTGTPLAVTGQLLAASSAESALAETYHFATVATDSDDYAPGETVTISGSGWQPGETVTLTLHEDPDIDEHAAFTAVADGLGHFTNTDFTPDVHDLNVRFTLTAKGAASEAQMTFTDANPNPASDGDGSMAAVPASVTSGTTNNFSFTFTGDNNKNFDAGSQVRLTIPAGWTAAQNANASAPGYVTMLSTTCQSASITTVTPTSVTLTIACDKQKTFALSYIQVTAPTVGSATPYTFTTETRIPSGTFKAIDLAQQPHPSPQVTVNPVSCTSPSVTTNPTNQTVTYGGSATFTAAASGNPAPTVQWQVNTGSGFTNIAGATATTLNVTTPSVSANGNRYQAVFTSSCNGTQTATTSPATLTVNTALLTVTADDKSRQYGTDNPPFTATISGLVNGEGLATSGVTGSASFTTSATASSAVGGYAIAPALGTLAAVNYSFTFANGTLTINKAPIIVTADPKTKTYGDADPALTSQVTSGTLATGDSFTGALSRDAGENVGGYAITQGTLALSSNYTLTYVGANLQITSRAVTVTADTKTKTYGDVDPALTYLVTSGSLATGDTFTGALSRTAGENVGDYPIGRGTLALSTNYTLSYIGANLKVTPRAVTVAADAQSKVYGGADPALTYKVTSGTPVNGDSFSGALTRATGEAVGSYAIGQGTLALSTNYALSYVGATLTITARPITVTADAKTKVYGNADPALTYQVTVGTLVGSDAFSGALVRTTGEAVGSYAIDQGTLALSTNYALSYVGANLTITARPITVTADAKTKAYGNADPALTYQASGNLVEGDSFSGALVRTTGEAVGSYAIGQGTLALSTNYALSYVGANLTITARPIMVTADAKAKVYGDADPALTYQVTVGTLVGSDAFSGALARAAGQSVGTYAITQGTLALSTNYALSYGGANLTITARPITVTADAKTKVYGNADPALTYQASGNLVEGDSFSGALVRTTGEAVGSYAIGQGTLALSTNYALSYGGATLTITARPITVTADAKTKVYGNADPALTYQASGNLVEGDSFSGALVRTTGEAVGSYAIGQGTLALSTNYALSYVGATLTITARPITVTADAKTKVYGNADPALTYQASGNLVEGDSFSGALVRTTGEAVGSYAIGQGTLALSTNYALSYVGATLTITARPITVTADAKTKVYGDADPALTYQVTVGTLVGSDAFSGALARAAGQSVGTYAIGQGTLALSSNYALTYSGANLTITPATPSIIVTGGPFTYDGSQHPAVVSVTGVGNAFLSGSLTVTYNNSSSVPIGAGTYAVGVTFVSGDANYKNASGAGTLLINKANQTVTLAGVPAAVTLGEGPFTVSASASSSLPVQITVSGSCSFSGSSLSITGPGACTVSANQSGNPNYNPAPEVVRTFNTVVSWSDLLQPINIDGSSIFKYSSTIPVKFRLTGASAGIGNLVARIMVARVSSQAIGSELEAISTSAADAGNTFRYDPTAGQYIFNLSTKLTGMTQGTWQILINLGDDVVHTVLVSTRN